MPDRSATLTSPEFTLPADGKGMSISFVWGNDHPSDLIVDETGLLKKQNVEGGNGVSDIAFEIFADGEWKQASYLSENAIEGTDGKKYWRNETIDLTQYAGKKVQFRWINRALSGRHNGASLDNIVIDGTIEDGVVFNREMWDAGKVNFGKAINSATIHHPEQGQEAPEGEGASPSTPTTSRALSLPATRLLLARVSPSTSSSMPARPAEGRQDEMSVEFESGYKATFPVKGEALAEDVLFYGFEKNPLDYDWKTDFTTIDVDKQVNLQVELLPDRD